MSIFSLVISLLVLLGWIAFVIAMPILLIIAAFVLYYTNYRVSPEMKMWRLQALYTKAEKIRGIPISTYLYLSSIDPVLRTFFVIDVDEKKLKLNTDLGTKISDTDPIVMKGSYQYGYIYKQWLEQQKEIQYDDIDNDIYDCFIEGKVYYLSTFGRYLEESDVLKIQEEIADNKQRLRIVEIEIAKICSANNGKYYKRNKKHAKFIILLNPWIRTYHFVNRLRSEGYKVTTFENALNYFNLNNFFNVDSLVKADTEYQEKITITN